MLRKEVVWFPLALLLALPLSAATYTFELDPAATKVDFTFGATLHTVDGFMRAKEGSVRIDPDTHEASGRFVLDATSDGTQVRGTGTMIVPYLDWGLKDPSFFLLRVEKEVRVTIHAVGRLSGGGNSSGQ